MDNSKQFYVEVTTRYIMNVPADSNLPQLMDTFKMAWQDIPMRGVSLEEDEVIMVTFKRIQHNGEDD